MTTTLDAVQAPADGAFGHRLAPPGDPLEGAAFDDVYEAKFKPELVKCEADRKNAVWAFALAIAAGLMLVAIELMLAPRSAAGAPPAPLIVLTLVGAGALGYLPLAIVAKKAKTSVILALCAPLGVSYSADAGSAPAWDEFLRLRLLPRPDGETFTDRFSGRRGQVDFELCEATLSE